ncbi:uncharacterized protein LOC127805048 [Diospyros lotus]|uniref:uncharacterized protein LOC127805048 n=1 Tax=Diospyros lotus TaxID=55363 RepID=UPI00225701E6|nr:uncharacterized protein LOC127805048 [Diospyros lotus]
MAAVPPKHLCIPTIKPYAGTIDPMDHLDLFTSHMMVQDASDVMWCRVFLATLEGNARTWYSNLAHHLIANFAQLQSSFLAHFAPLQRHRRSTMALVNLKQKQGESLKDFVSRPFTQSLAKTPPLKFTDILGQATKYINVEEVMQAKRAKYTEKKEKKKHSEENKSEGRREDRSEKCRPRWESSSFTPLNAPRAEILVTIEGKDYLKKPLPMWAQFNKRNRNKYCRFHRDYCHDIEECHQLKEEIKEIQELINRGFLKSFMAREADPRKGREPRLHGNENGRRF